jgi:hypothetical protein
VSATEWRWDPTLQQWYEGVIEHAAELDAFNFESWKARSAEWARGEIVREEMWRQGQVDSHDLWIRFEQFLSKTFRRTLRNAANTYLLVTALSTLMFLTGLGLFVFAAWYGSQEGNDKAYAVLFGGMGAATFVTLMVIQPLDRAQSALSNLMQAELCFMTTFQQIRLWQAYPYDQEGRLDPARMEAATTNIDRLTRDAMALLERYLEPPPQTPTRRRAAGPEKDGPAPTPDA